MKIRKCIIVEVVVDEVVVVDRECYMILFDEWWDLIVGVGVGIVDIDGVIFSYVCFNIF